MSTRMVVWLNRTEYEVAAVERFTQTPTVVFALEAVEVVAANGRRAWLNGRLVEGVYVEDTETVSA